MRSVRTLILLLASAICGLAWNETGHCVIAVIAFFSLSAAEREAIFAILQDHPDFIRWVEGLTEAPREQQMRAAVEAASVWPDDLRRDPRFFSDEDPRSKNRPFDPRIPDLGRHTDWHFINKPLIGRNLARLVEGTDTAYRDPPNVLERIPFLRQTLQNPHGSQRLFRGYYMAWLLHLIGDIHQPLHTVARMDTPAGPGDRGGNDFRLEPFAVEPIRKPVDNLHALWDNLLGQALQSAAIEATARRLQMLHPRTAKAAQLDPEVWFEESVQEARTFVYRGLNKAPRSSRGVVIPSQYFARAQVRAGRRAALAGYRLAGVLAEIARAQARARVAGQIQDGEPASHSPTSARARSRTSGSSPKPGIQMTSFSFLNQVH